MPIDEFARRPGTFSVGYRAIGDATRVVSDEQQIVMP